MKTYLVGGAVRDKLLNLAVNERDWVVVGSTPEEMLKYGYRPVGKDFPVFLHPESKEEYALARTERKSGTGHKGFTFYTATDVTLEQDLARRDLTINAIAQSEDGELIDPYQGKADIKHHVLRHITDAFSEDPLRVFRVARFAAKLGQFNFTVAPETMKLMHQLVTSGECNHLSAERVWNETKKALHTTHPAKYFQTLKSCGALHFIGDIQADAIELLGAHSIEGPLVNWMLLTYNGSVNLRTPRTYQDVHRLIADHHQSLANWPELTSKQQLNVMSQCDFLRKSERFQLLIQVAAIIHNVNIKTEFDQLLQALKNIDYANLAEQHKGQALQHAVSEARLQVLADYSTPNSL